MHLRYVSFYVSNLCIKSKLGLSQVVHRTPYQAVYRDYHERHDDGSEQQNGKLTMIAGCADLCTQPKRLQGAIFEMKIFGDDAGVPGAAGRSDQAGDEVRKDAWQNHDLPTLPQGEFVELGYFLQVGGNSGGAGNHIKEDVPLGAQQHKRNRPDAQTAAPADERDQQ